MYCQKCGTQHDGKFCPNCGEPAPTQNWDQTTSWQPASSSDNDGFNSPDLDARVQNGKQPLKLYEKTWFIVLLLLFFWPIGLILMWRQKSFNVGLRIVISIFCLIFFITTCFTMFTSSPSNDTLITSETESIAEVTVSEPVSEADTNSVTMSAEEDSSATVGEKNALRKAHDYLNYTNFSYDGLIGQLQYEGFTETECVYAADNCGADWNEQALGDAKSYLAYSAFSYTGLIEQLEYEGFTNEQATYGVDNCAADWKEQAAKCAEQYLEYSSFSRQGLIDQLIYEGFTQDQATYGVDQTGL